MSVVATTLILGGLIVLLIRTRQVRLLSAMVCTVFGLVLAMTPAAGSVNEVLNASGQWLWVQARSL